MLFRRADKTSPRIRRASLGGTLGWLVPGRKVVRHIRTNRWKASDFVVAGLGLALGFGCAVFPWYIFFNQEKFGVRAMKFEGNSNQLRSAGMRIDESLVDELDTGVALPEELDLFATGTIPDETEDEDKRPRVVPAEQEFPGDPVGYRMIHATPGRAMIADDSSIWVVQRGSLLPDNSYVSSIEQRGRTWVLVTSNKRTVELSAN